MDKTSKEYKREYYRQYRLKNKDKVKKANEKWRKKIGEDAYKEICKVKSKRYRDKFDDGYQRVYLLEDYNYVGVTKNILNRFNRHQQRHNRDCTNYRILYKSKSREDCLELEALLHDMGYEGRHSLNSYK